MITRLLGRVMAPRILPQVAAVFFLILAITPEAKWRLRDPSASAAGSADLQTLVELGFYSMIGLWAAWHLLRGWTSHRYRIETMGPALLVAVGVALLVISTGTLAGSSRALIRSFQYGVMITTTLVIWWEVRANAAFFQVFWRIVRRGFVAFALFATAVTAVVPAFDGSLDDAGIRRYGWMEIHPITTAGMLGVALIAILGAYLGLPDRLVLRRWVRIGSLGLAVVFLGLLVLTNSRGATVATGLGLVMLVVLTPRKQLRRFALLGLLVAVGLAIAYFTSEGGSSQLQGFVNRGQTTEQVLSLSQRTTLFEIGMEYVAEKPIFGHGYMIPGTLLRTHFEWAGHAHNVALEVLMSMGVVGIGAYLVLIFVAIRGLVLGLGSTVGRLTGIAAEGSALLTLILVQGVISDGFGGPVGWEVSVLMLAVIISDLGRYWRSSPSAAETLEITELPHPLAPSAFAPIRPGARRSAFASAAYESTGTKADEDRIDINTATLDELTALPGVGRRIAARIVVHRSSRGNFVSVDELIEVKGVGRIVLSRIRPHATVSTPQGRPLRLRRW